jgi:hypothetical protein
MLKQKWKQQNEKIVNYRWLYFISVNIRIVLARREILNVHTYGFDDRDIY